MVYPSFEVTNTFTNGTLADADEVNANFTDVETAVDGASAVGVPAVIGMVPIGSVIPWHKTFTLVDSGTADTNTLNALEDSGADFIVDGVKSGMIVYNSDDSTYAIADVVTAIKITLKADANAGSALVDAFPLGSEAYSIYATPELPDNWVECNGLTTVSDVDSPFNGTLVPDYTSRFIFGSAAGAVTGALAGSLTTSVPSAWTERRTDAPLSWVATYNHTHTFNPIHFTMVFIMRIK